MKRAIIKTGGKQYNVAKGDVISVEKLEAKEKDSIELDTLLVFDKEGKEVAVGAPTVEKAKVSATVVEHGKGKKTIVLKYKPKIRYKKKYGHRQPYTKLEITEIVT